MQPFASHPPCQGGGGKPATLKIPLRGLDRWLLPYLLQTPRRWTSRPGPASSIEAGVRRLRRARPQRVRVRRKSQSLSRRPMEARPAGRTPSVRRHSRPSPDRRWTRRPRRRACSTPVALPSEVRRLPFCRLSVYRLSGFLPARRRRPRRSSLFREP